MRTEIMKAQVAAGSATLTLFAALISAQATPVTLSKLHFDFLFARTPVGSDPGFQLPVTSPLSLPLQAPVPLTQFIVPGSDPGTTIDSTSTYSVASTEFGDFQTQAIANADVQLDAALSRTGAPLDGAFYMTIVASNSYQLVVNQKPGKTVPAGVTTVPINQTAAGSVRCSPSLEGVGIVSAAAEVDVTIPSYPLLDEEIATCGGTQEAFSGPTGVTFPVGKPAFVTVSASGLIQLAVGGGFGSSQSATFEAKADPAFEIDPSFLYADDFEIDYSPGFSPPTGTPTDVPEPSSLLLLAVGALLTLISRGRRAETCR